MAASDLLISFHERKLSNKICEYLRDNPAPGPWSRSDESLPMIANIKDLAADEIEVSEKIANFNNKTCNNIAQFSKAPGPRCWIRKRVPSRTRIVQKSVKGGQENYPTTTTTSSGRQKSPLCAEIVMESENFAGSPISPSARPMLTPVAQQDEEVAGPSSRATSTGERQTGSNEHVKIDLQWRRRPDSSPLRLTNFKEDFGVPRPRSKSFSPGKVISSWAGSVKRRLSDPLNKKRKSYDGLGDEGTPGRADSKPEGMGLGRWRRSKSTNKMEGRSPTWITKGKYRAVDDYNDTPSWTSNSDLSPSPFSVSSPSADYPWDAMAGCHGYHLNVFGV